MLGIGTPMLSGNFYLSSVGCCPDADLLAFKNEYNLAMLDLVQRHGVPDWAPGRRVLDRRAALSVLRETTSRFDEETSPDIARQAESTTFSIRRCHLSKKGPWVKGWCHLVDKEVLLVAGDLSSQRGFVEVLDWSAATHGFLMARHQYDRKKNRSLPWDDLPAMQLRV